MNKIKEGKKLKELLNELKKMNAWKKRKEKKE